MSIIRINQLPSGSGNLTNDDIFPFMDDPSGSGITKQISLSQIAAAIGTSSSSEAASLVTNVFNKTGSPIPKMAAVYISGGQGDQPTISLAQASGEATSSKTYGLTAETINNMSAGKVIVFGALTGLNTDQFNPTAPTGDVNGVTLYLSPTTPGGLTTTKPSAPNHMVAIGTIIRTHQNQGIIEVRVQNGFELEELHNVAISGVTNGQFLQYNSGSGLWLASSSGNFSSLSVDNLNFDNNTISSSSGNIIISPSGNGTLQRGSEGDARGVYAVDWQGVRVVNTQVASGPYSTIGGGKNNTSSGYHSTVGGGAYNTASNNNSTVGGGEHNLAQAPQSSVFGGANNVIAGKVKRANNIVGLANNIRVLNATVADFDNTAVDALQIRYSYNNNLYFTTRTVSSVTSPDPASVLISLTTSIGAIGQIWEEVLVVNTAETETIMGGAVGGISNTVSGETATVSGGRLNTASGSRSAVGGGFNNTASGNYSTVGGGKSNRGSNFSTVGGGQDNSADGDYSTINGGRLNTASNLYSTVFGGINNTASGESSIIGGGVSNTASGYRSIVFAGRNNTVSGNYSVIAGGTDNTASSYHGAIGGGYNNTSIGTCSVIGGGKNNTASGYYSVIGGGKNNTASAYYSVIGGGKNNTASAFHSTISGGFRAVADRYGMQAYAAGNFSEDGDSQRVDFVLRNITTNNTSTTLFLNGSNARLTIPSNKALFATINIAGIIDGGSKAAHYVRKVAIKNVGGTTSLIGTVSTLGSDVEDDALYDVTITADNTNDALQINVTGKTGETIRWVAHVEGVEILYG